MREIYILLLLIVCTSCVSLYRAGVARYYYMPTLRYKETNRSWEIFTPPEGEWIAENKEVIYLPEYFSAGSVGKFSGSPNRNSNFFYAQYALGDNIHLSLWVRPATAFKVEKARWGAFASGIDNGHEERIDHSTECISKQSQYIDIGINSVGAEFDNTSTYFLKNGKKIPGEEVDFSPRSGVVGYRDTQPLPHAVYDLGSPQTLTDKQPYFRRDIDHPTFYFRFPMTCADLEDAILVIDGFSQNGKPLPPLKVRFNYWDPGAVPGLGAKTTVAR